MKLEVPDELYDYLRAAQRVLGEPDFNPILV